MNPFCEIAVEEAIRLKEQGKATEILAVSIGDNTCQETIRTALALGVDKGIHINTDSKNLPSLSIAKILKSIVEQEKVDLVILGKQSIDGDNNQTGQMLSALLAWPQATFASNLEFCDENIHVTREIDGGLETLSVSLPAVITTDLRLNEPRYASLPNIMKAKRKPLDKIELSELNLDLKEHQKVIKVSAPEVRQAGEKVESVEQLLDKLKNEAKVL